MIDRILAFDLGTSLGYTMLVNDPQWSERLFSGTTKLPQSCHGRVAHLTAACLEFERLINAHRPTVVAYEAVRQLRGMDATYVWVGIETCLLLTCERLSVRTLGIPVATVKKIATGRGNADKLAMWAAASRRWPNWVAATEDEVDSRWVAVAAAAGATPITEAHRRKRSKARASA